MLPVCRLLYSMVGSNLVLVRGNLFSKWYSLLPGVGSDLVVTYKLNTPSISVLGIFVGAK